MKKVLIIGYPFPWRRGGSPRLLGLAKYLHEFDWQPVILTAPLDQSPDPQFRVIETPYHDALGFWKKMFHLEPGQDIRRQVKERFGVTSRKSLMDFFITRAGEIVNYPDPERGWEPFAVEAGDRLFAEEKIDAIISTSAPMTTHFIARKLKKGHGVPWIADLRDLWSQNHNYIYSPIRRWFDRRLELKTLASADALVTVSQPWADEMGTLHKGKSVFAITNGFDPETLNIPPVRLTDKFTITYTGTIHQGKQDTSKLFRALRDLTSNGVMNPDNVEVRFYRPEEGWLEKEAEAYGLSGIVRQYGQVPRTVSIEKQRESQVLLVINWEEEGGIVGISGKLFEYLASQRPILNTGGLGNYMTEDLLKETKAGIHAPTVEDVKNSIKELYQEYKIKGKVAYHGDIKEINKYSHREMAKKFFEILGQLSPD